jgi:hypothetical protein
MKKIFTFLFFAGLMTSAMAQNSRNGQYRNQGNGNHSSVYANNGQEYSQSNNGFSQPVQGNNSYTQRNDNNLNNGYHQNEQAYNHNSENGYGNDRRFDERNDDRRFRGNDRFDQRAYSYDRRKEFERYNRGRFNERFSIRYGQASCY